MLWIRVIISAIKIAGCVLVVEPYNITTTHRQREHTPPEVKHRILSPLERDFEENFTVLMGDYSAMLIECMFQDNKEDVKLLSDPEFNEKVVDAYRDW